MWACQNTDERLRESCFCIFLCKVLHLVYVIFEVYTWRPLVSFSYSILWQLSYSFSLMTAIPLTLLLPLHSRHVHNTKQVNELTHTCVGRYFIPYSRKCTVLSSRQTWVSESNITASLLEMITYSVSGRLILLNWSGWEIEYVSDGTYWQGGLLTGTKLEMMWGLNI